MLIIQFLQEHNPGSQNNRDATRDENRRDKMIR